MPIQLSRRIFLQSSLAGLIGSGCPNGAAAGTRTISQITHHYHGWPTLAQRASGELLLVYSAAREQHVCPFGRVDMMRSVDEGETWTFPQTLLDGPIDDRDAGVMETNKGSLLVTTFSSLAYEATLAKLPPTDDRYRRWMAAHQRVSKQQRQRALGVWMTRSEDGGVTWSGRYRCLVNSPHGPIQLADGRQLYAGKALWQSGRVGVCESRDDGRNWNWLADIPIRDGDQSQHYHELHAVECASGRIIVHIRNHNSQHSRETLQCHSDDGGQSWSTPTSIGVWGLPSHLLRLRDDRLLMTYGYRRAPFGNQARISHDQGTTWSQPVIISDDGAGGDLGYPSTVELKDNSLLSVWYEKLAGQPNAVLRQARWKLE